MCLIIRLDEPDDLFSDLEDELFPNDEDEEEDKEEEDKEEEDD